MEEETGNHDKAERIAEITDHMISLFGLWNYGNTVPYLLIAGYRKDVEKCVQLIKQLLSESQKPWNMTQSLCITGMKILHRKSLFGSWKILFVNCIRKLKIRKSMNS